jgi:serine/threonine protein kinase
MGLVWRATDTRLHRIVAIKIARAQFSERVQSEARCIAKLNHPHICTIYDVGENYIVMEFLDGKPLRGPLSIDDALVYGIQIADALDAAHRNGIVHRDLKPTNIVVTRAGTKLLDFGLALQRSEGADPNVTVLDGSVANFKKGEASSRVAHISGS